MAKIAVAPLVGAWIEILLPVRKTQRSWSLPSWERGLKYQINIDASVDLRVAPLVGAWIEIA